MPVQIETLSVQVSGQVVRKFDGSLTTLTITGDQARELHGQLGSVLQFLDGQAPTPVA